jgi:hypothetical protein
MQGKTEAAPPRYLYRNNKHGAIHLLVWKNNTLTGNTTHTDSFSQKRTYGHTWNHASRLQPYIHGGGKGIGQLTVSTYVRRLSPYPKFRTSSIFDKTYIIEILYVTRIHHQLLIKFCYIIFKTNKYFFSKFLIWWEHWCLGCKMTFRSKCPFWT